MSDLMLHGVLNMPLPDDPREMSALQWGQFRSRARQASTHIDAQDAKIKALVAVVESITYEDKGRYFVGIIGDTDVTDLVSSPLAAAKETT